MVVGFISEEERRLLFELEKQAKSFYQEVGILEYKKANILGKIAQLELSADKVIASAQERNGIPATVLCKVNSETREIVVENITNE